MQFLYLGFVQQANLRCFKFQGVLPRERAGTKTAYIEFCLNADMALLSKFRVRFQDGPALCLEILSAALLETQNPERFAAYTVTSADLTAYMSAKNSIEAAKPPRRRPRAQFKPAESSQLKWPTVS